MYGNKMQIAVLMRCNVADLDTNESIYIEAMDTVHPRGYNLRCGSKAATTETKFSLSTFVHKPVVYESDRDEQDVKAAVTSSVQEIVGDSDIVPWAGIVQRSVKCVNALRGAKQHSSWAGPVKGAPVTSVDESGVKSDEHEPNKTKSMAKQKYWNARYIRQRKDMDTYNLDRKKHELEMEELKRKDMASKIKFAEDQGMLEQANKLKRKLQTMLES
jgi:hypothetical protein